MKKLFAFFAAMIFAAQVFGQDFGVFNKIDISAPVKVEIVTGEKQHRVVAKGNCEDFIRDLRFEVDGKTLYIKLDPHKRKYVMKNGEVVVTVYVDDLTNLNTSGACSVRFIGKTALKNLDIDNSGATKTEIPDALISGKFHADISGASKLDISGDFSDVEIEASGASTIIFSGNAEVFDLDVSGASTIILSGSADIFILEASGATKVMAEGFKARKSKIDYSGAAKILMD